jgi:4-hydroxy-tetrahydrodipicolinate reductase
MRILVLGAGKTGSLIPEIARERGHRAEVLRAAENPQASALTAELLAPFDVVINFTSPDCVLANIRMCVAAGKNLVVGTTGWYDRLPDVRAQVEKNNTGFVYGPNFSIGVNLFFDLVRASLPAIHHRYSGRIYERHHAQKKDAPSGTAATMQNILQADKKTEIEITSFREGDVVGMHELVFDSPVDSIYLCHDAKSRRGFAQGAVRAAEWISGKQGFFEFRDVWREM